MNSIHMHRHIYIYIGIHLHTYAYVYMFISIARDCTCRMTCFRMYAYLCVHVCKWCIQPVESHTKKLLMRKSSSTHEMTAWMTSGKFWVVGFWKAAEMACGNSKPVKSLNCVVMAEGRSLLECVCVGGQRQKDIVLVRQRCACVRVSRDVRVCG